LVPGYYNGILHGGPDGPYVAVSTVCCRPVLPFSSVSSAAAWPSSPAPAPVAGLLFIIPPTAADGKLCALFNSEMKSRDRGAPVLWRRFSLTGEEGPLLSNHLLSDLLKSDSQRIPGSSLLP
jgi:hypothetical protein